MKRRKTALMEVALNGSKIHSEINIGSMRLYRDGDVRYWGDYMLVRAKNDTFIMDVDRPRGFLERWFGRRMRKRALRLADKLDKNVIPVSFNAVSRAEVYKRDCKLIERRGFEAAFHCAGRYYLSGFDSNEASLTSRGLYFLTQLPREVTSVADAREALKPESVVEAERRGDKVYRQGDLFAISTDITSNTLREQKGTFKSRTTLGRNTLTATSLYGTAHTADVVATLPDGTQLARGRLIHDPSLIGDRRKRDHRPCKLQRNRWHVIAKNATPIVKPKSYSISSIGILSTDTVV